MGELTYEKIKKIYNSSKIEKEQELEENYTNYLLNSDNKNFEE